MIFPKIFSPTVRARLFDPMPLPVRVSVLRSRKVIPYARVYARLMKQSKVIQIPINS